MTVNPDDFTCRMSSHWCELGNHLNEALQQSWWFLANLLNNRQSDQFNDVWDVVPLPTGTGKSQSLALYCSMLPIGNHPGVLIVTPFRKQADEICTLINRMSGKCLAVSHHRENLTSYREMAQSPILAITHAAYLSAHRMMMEGRECESKLHHFMSWNAGQRNLTVIDEAIDLHRTYRVGLKDISMALGAMCDSINDEAKRQLKMLEALAQSVRCWRDHSKSREREIDRSELALLETLDFDLALQSLSCIPSEELRFGTDNKIPGSKVKEQCQSTLRRLQNVSRIGYGHVSRSGNVISIAASERSLVNGHKSGVILDATARCDARYSLMASRVRIMQTPTGARTYDPVTLWVLPDQRVGKNHMVKHARSVWSEVARDVATEVGRDRRVLVCCHKDAKADIESVKTSFCMTDFAHWGDITGKNEWQHHDTAVIIGLNYLEQSVLTQTAVGLLSRTNEKSTGPSMIVPCEVDDDVRARIRDSHLAVSVIQGVNRIRCRRTTDRRGACLPADIFLLAPKGMEGVKLIETIRHEMPGIQIRYIKCGSATRKSKKAPAQSLVFEYLQRAPVGHYTNAQLRELLNVSKTTFDRVVTAFVSERHGAAHTLKRSGVRYISQSGRGRQSGFIVERLHAA